MSPPDLLRILLVDDDSSMRALVGMALEEMPVELVTCADLATARVALAQGPWALLLTDLMLPDGSGLELIRETLHRSGPAAPRMRVVLSAGLSAPVRRLLVDLAVDHVLEKPVSIADLISCVQRAQAMAAATAIPSTQFDPAGDSLLVSIGGHREQAIAQYFNGDVPLFEAIRAQCQDRFLVDVQEGDAAAARADMALLRRLAHSLKSICRMIGLPMEAELARQIEVDVESDPATVLQRWDSLKAGLQAAMNRYRRSGS